ncbi:putative bifunctional diguanylate cyclase/phosphodiesterase [Glaciecola siphonariae]|uniref:Bifunctional diguanylate cyclase/phosphodiesterase n=1 Tax=Glaciecola siphonariae TaxID=521012 RepID=A0ABV9LTA7_9ALTE
MFSHLCEIENTYSELGTCVTQLTQPRQAVDLFSANTQNGKKSANLRYKASRNSQTQAIHPDVKNEMLEQLLEQSQHALVVVNGDRHIIQINRAFEQITGYQEDDVIGVNASFLCSNAHDKGFYTQIWNELLHFGFWEGEINSTRKNGEIYSQAMSIKAYPREATEPEYFIAMFKDVSKQIAQTTKLSNLAFFDQLTGCGNRALYMASVTSLIDAQPTSPFTVFLLNIDFFKLVNNSHGHEIGNALLKAIVVRLSNVLGEQNTIFRLSSDEFLILLPDESDESAQSIAAEVIDALQIPFDIQGSQIDISTSMGVARYPQHANSAVNLLNRSNIALKNAKQYARGTFLVFAKSMLETSNRSALIERHLNQAISRNELWLAFMPQINCSTEECNRAEVLLRWDCKALGEVMPNEFIPIAEKSGLINTITAFVLQETLAHIRKLNAISSKRFILSFNATIHDLRKPLFFDKLIHILCENKDICHQLVCELTESTFAEDIDVVRANLGRLKALGVSISIDDFGTCYSSLSYLKDLPVDEVKIDQTFTRNLLIDSKQEKIYAAICQLSQSLNLSCVAEGVESRAQLNWLVDAGCDYSQGYLHCAPKMFSSFVSLYA